MIEEWHAVTATTTYVFNSYSDLYTWISLQTQSPIMVHRVSKKTYVVFGIQGGEPWPPPPQIAPTWNSPKPS